MSHILAKGAQTVPVQIDRVMHLKMVSERKPVSPMVDFVARAICKSRTCEGFQCCQYPAQMAHKSICPVDRGGYDDAAIDAIEAMAEFGAIQES